MTLAQLQGYHAATVALQLDDARLALFVSRGAAADEKGYNAVLKALGSNDR
jgi:hypothetical protein